MMLLKSITALTAFGATATAGLISRDTDAAQAISNPLLLTLNLFEQYSAAAYCFSNDVASPGTLVRCSAGNCPLVERAGATIGYSFLDIGVGGVAGFIATDTVYNTTVIAFRGVRAIRQWLWTLDNTLTTTTLCGTTTDCMVSQGFLRAWDSVSDRIITQLNTLIDSTSIATIAVVGHGFGGALATLAATQLRNARVYANVSLYTYGSPRVGNNAFANLVTNYSTSNFRVTHTDDPVPKFPSRSLGYLQWGPEYWIRSSTGQPVRTFDVDGPINGTETSQGNGGTPLSFDIPAHKWYFNHVTACFL